MKILNHSLPYNPDMPTLINIATMQRPMLQLLKINRLLIHPLRHIKPVLIIKYNPLPRQHPQTHILLIIRHKPLILPLHLRIHLPEPIPNRQLITAARRERRYGRVSPTVDFGEVVGVGHPRLVELRVQLGSAADLEGRVGEEEVRL
jgi:hypothetical protein